MSGHRLVVVLGDQLSPGIASMRAADKNRDTVLMCEVMAEATYVRHHKKKIALVFSAMRHFAEALREAGWSVDYVRLEDPGNSGSLGGEVARAIERRAPEEVLVTEPGEWRLRQEADGWAERFDLDVTVLEDDRFLCSHAEFADWAEGRRQLRMEDFYRQMRRKTGLLMTGDNPEGGRWNFDAENRRPPASGLVPPGPYRVEPDAITLEVLALVEQRFASHFGDLRPFRFAVTHAESNAALDHFIAEALPDFGDYQDAMQRGERFLYHAVVSAYLNVGLLDPLDTCRRVEAAYRSGKAPINAVEGFIRQIIGWREFVRGIYWLRMPGYVDENRFGHDRPLPDFYWTGDTDMACLAAAIGQTKEEAYAHHIQRLMITGNFALLAGIDPRAVHEWYLTVYADAFEWVELPNTLGMSQFADGGLLASKPYVSSGNYINRMSDYCKGCAYDVKRKIGAGACPFNALYWDFLARHADLLRPNPRLSHAYRNWDRMDPDTKRSYRASARAFLGALHEDPAGVSGRPAGRGGLRAGG